MTKLDHVLKQWGLEVSPEQTDVLSIDRYDRAGLPDITLRGHELKNVDEFKYLGTLFTKQPLARTPRRKPEKKTAKSKQKEAVPQQTTEKSPAPKQKTKAKTPKRTSCLTENRITKANSSFYSYAAPLYRRKDIPMKHKLKIFKMTTIPTLLYGSEVWAPAKDEIQRLESWQHRCIR